jgi:hypothetical protein
MFIYVSSSTFAAFVSTFRFPFFSLRLELFISVNYGCLLLVEVLLHEKILALVERHRF